MNTSGRASILYCVMYSPAPAEGRYYANVAFMFACKIDGDSHLLPVARDIPALRPKNLETRGVSPPSPSPPPVANLSMRVLIRPNSIRFDPHEIPSCRLLATASQ